MKSQQVTRPSLVVSSVTGVLAAMCISIIFSLIYPYFVLNGSVTEGSIRVASPVAQFIASLLGAIIVGKLMKEDRMLAMGLSAGIYATLLLCGALLLFDGVSDKIIFGLAAILAGSVFAMLLVNKSKKRSRRSRKKFGSR